MKNFKSTSYILPGIALCLGLLISCQKDDPTDPNVPNLRSLSTQEREVAKSSNDFAFEIFRKINADHSTENTFISPFSISTALSMTLNGTSGPTLDSMKAALHPGSMTTSEMNTAYRDLVDFLLGLDKTVTLKVANSNWYRNDLTIHQDFESVLNEYYQAEVQASDFTDPGTVDDINGWIETHTEGKIKEMLDEIPPDAIMYLINAVYFKAEWQYQFDKNQTKDMDFFLPDGSTKAIPTMYSEGVTLNHSQLDDLVLVDLPYGNGQYTFTIIMPSDLETDVNDMISSFDQDKLEALTSTTAEYSIPVYLPKFKIEFKKLLNDVLIDMGMGIAFSGEADFSQLFEDDITAMISRVIHQSFLEVNEEGSEAAAATIVEVVETSAGPPTAIHIDRPFMFFIREKHSNTILFAGKVVGL